MYNQTTLNKYCYCWRTEVVISSNLAVSHNVITHTPYTFTNWQWTSRVQHTSHTHKWKHTSYLKVCHDFRRPSIFNLTYLYYPLIAVQWHNLHVLIACLNLQFHDTISCQMCCYLIFWNLLVYLSEVENSKYGTRNTSTAGSTTATHSEQ